MSVLSVIALTLVGLGGVGFVIERDERVALGALLAQWLGLVCASLTLDYRTTNAFRLGRESAVEFVAALVCGAVLWLTLRSLYNAPGKIRQARPRMAYYLLRFNSVSFSEYLLPSAVALLGGAAGAGFATLFPLATQESDLAFYWTVLTGLLALVLDGARNIIKLTAGLLALLNAIALLVYSLSVTPPNTALLGLLAAIRIGLVVMVAYGWLLNAQLSKDLNLGSLYTTRDEKYLLLTAPQPKSQAQPQDKDAGGQQAQGKPSKIKEKPLKPKNQKKGRR